MSVLLTLIGNEVTNSRKANGVLNSLKDDDNAQVNWSTFGLKVIPNCCNLNSLSLMLIPSIDIGIDYNSVEKCFLKNIMVKRWKRYKYVLVSLKIYGKVYSSTSRNISWITFSKIFLIDSASTFQNPFTWIKLRNLNSTDRVQVDVFSKKRKINFSLINNLNFWPKY